MMKRITTLGLALSFAAVFNGCGGEENQPLDAMSTGLVLGTFKAQVLGNLPTGDNLPALPITGVNVGLGNDLEVKATSCETVTPAVRVDNDNDGIALEKTYTFDCVDVAEATRDGTMYVTRKGSVKIQDLNDSPGGEGVYGGVRVDFDLPVYKNVLNGNEFNFMHVGFWHYYAEGDTLISESEYTGRNSYGYPDGLKNDYTYTSTWNYKYTPTDPANRWSQGGKIDIEGTFKLSGLFINEVDNVHSQGEGTFFVNYKGIGIENIQTCSKNPSAGSYLIEDGNGTKIEIRYFCDEAAKLYVNGEPSDWWTP